MIPANREHSWSKIALACLYSARIISWVGVALVGILEAPRDALAQITPDSTLSTAVTTTDNLNFVIENGDRANNNLFHSFEEFSIPSNGSAIFNHDTDISTIFSRITGTTVSDIDGLLQSNGNADFFLINPNGIVFGPNAQLDVGGSFLATTADSVLFDDGVEFRATNPVDEPLLSIHTPIGLQMGIAPGPIQLIGNSDILTNSTLIPFIFFPIRQPANPAHLEVSSGHTLALVGGDISLTGSALRTPEGRVELGSVSSGLVDIVSDGNGWGLIYDHVTPSQDIILESRSAIDASGLTSQGIQLVGNDITLNDGSIVLMEVSGMGSNAGVNIMASDTVTINGTDSVGALSSGLFIQTLGSAEAGDLTLEASSLRLQDGGMLESTNFGDSPGSDITLDVENTVLMDGFSRLTPSRISTAVTFALGAGQGGNINLVAPSLTLTNGGSIASLSFGNTGSSGDIFIDAANIIEIMGSTDIIDPAVGQIIPSSINTSTSSQGDAGRIEVNTARLSLSNGGDIDSSTLSLGNAGEVILNATESIQLVSIGTDVSRIRSAALRRESLRASLGLDNDGFGNGGSVIINTPRLRLIGENVGDSTISVANEGSGRAGTLRVNAGSILLEQGSQLLATTASGEGGNIDLTLTGLLSLRDESQISATAQALDPTESAEPSVGNGGNIRIESPFIVSVATENSDIIANAVRGNGGNVNIVTQGIFGLELRDRLTPDNDITASSEFGLDGTVEINTPEVDPNSQILELPDTLVDASQLVRPGCASNDNIFALTGRGGLPPSPLALLNGDRPWTDIRDLSAFLNNQSSQFIIIGRGGIPLQPDDKRPWIHILPDFGATPSLSSLSVPIPQETSPLNDSPVTLTELTNHRLSGLPKEATGMAIAPNGTLQLVATHSQNVTLPHASCTS